MDKNRKFIEDLFELLGGKGNIISVENCMTRLRITLKDDSLSKISDIKSLDGVLGVVENPLQVIVGPGKAKKTTDIANELLNSSNSNDDIEKQDNVLKTLDWEQNKSKIKGDKKESRGQAFLKKIAGIFIPLIPAIIAAGLFNGIAGLITNLQKTGSIDPANPIFTNTATFLNLMGGAFLAYFAIYVGINSAKVFGATQALGGMIGAVTIMPQINNLSQAIGLFNEDTPLSSILQTGRGGILAVILGVFLLSVIEKFIRKHTPDVLDLIVTPLASVLATTILVVLVIMPITGYISDGLMYVLGLFMESNNIFVSIISGYVLAAVFLPLVLVGMHQALTPIYALQLSQNGYITLFSVLAMAGGGQVGSSIAIYIKAKRQGKNNLTRTIAGALPAGILGIGEPLLYGVTLPLGRPFITGGLGAGFGGAYIMATHVKSVAFGTSGLPGVLLVMPESMIHYIIGLLIAVVAGFILSYIFVKEDTLERF